MNSIDSREGSVEMDPLPHLKSPAEAGARTSLKVGFDMVLGLHRTALFRRYHSNQDCHRASSSCRGKGEIDVEWVRSRVMLWLGGFAQVGPQAGKGETRGPETLTTFDVSPRRQLCCPALRHDQSPGKDDRTDFADLAGWANLAEPLYFLSSPEHLASPSP